MDFEELSDFQKRTFIIGKPIIEQLKSLDIELLKTIESLEIPEILRLFRINYKKCTTDILSLEIGFKTDVVKKIENGDFRRTNNADLNLIFNSFDISEKQREVIDSKILELKLKDSKYFQRINVAYYEKYFFSSFKEKIEKLKEDLSKKLEQTPLTDEQAEKFEKFLAPDALNNDIIEPVKVLDGQGYREPKIQEHPDKSIIINNLVPEKPTKPSTLLRDVENAIFKAREKAEQKGKW
jgi:hypothetical protein